MIYLVEPMNINTRSECPLDDCMCNAGGCFGAMTPPSCSIDICGCKGGREGCCGLGGRTPEHRLFPTD